jgi:hypothetical protein
MRAAMKRLLALAVPCLFVACGEQTAAAANEAARLLDQASKTVKELPAYATATQTLADLGGKLATIRDGATATKAKAELAALAQSLQTQLGSLGGAAKVAAGGAEQAMRTIADQLTKLASNPEVQKAIGPVLEQLRGLVGSK